MDGAKTRPRVDVNALIAEFYEGDQHDSLLGRFQHVDHVPPPYAELLDHNHHMTVTVEAFYRGPVDVEVLQYLRRDQWYVREIILKRSADKKPVQYGIVRFDTSSVDTHVWQRIESRDVPLGRVLIEEQVHRQVELCQLWQIQMGSRMAGPIGAATGEMTYGRTALIYCNHVPAIELLEVMIPLPPRFHCENSKSGDLPPHESNQSHN